MKRIQSTGESLAGALPYVTNNWCRSSAGVQPGWSRSCESPSPYLNHWVTISLTSPLKKQKISETNTPWIHTVAGN